jgi:hypothetical protein
MEKITHKLPQYQEIQEIHVKIPAKKQNDGSDSLTI